VTEISVYVVHFSITQSSF